jgi:RNA polymerase sigma factor FliA
MISTTPVMTATRYAPLQATRESLDLLILQHMQLVRSIARHVHARMSRTPDVEDLTQVGMIALVEASRVYVDYGEASFATYAATRIRGAMMDELRRQATMSRGALKRRRDMINTTQKLSSELKREPTTAELVTRLGITLAEYQALQHETRGVQYDSLDDVYSDQSAWFTDEDECAFEKLSKEQLKQRLAGLIRQLPEREALVLQLYFVEELNLEEIGQVLDVGSARVCQIKKSALDKIRHMLGALTSSDVLG